MAAMRRMERHEVMAGDIDRFVIDRGEIPRLVFENRRRDGVDRRAPRHQLREQARTAIGLQIDLIDLRDHQREIGFTQFVRVHAKIRDRFAKLRRMDAPFRQRPAFLGMDFKRFRELVGDADAADRFGRMRRVPSDDMRLAASLCDDVPKRLGFARGAAGRANAVAVGGRFDEAEDSVLVRAFAGGDRIPEDRRQCGAKRRDISHHAALDEARQRRHLSGVHQRGNHLPIRGVPTHEQNTRSQRSSRHRQISVSAKRVRTRRERTRVMVSTRSSQNQTADVSERRSFALPRRTESPTAPTASSAARTARARRSGRR